MKKHNIQKELKQEEIDMLYALGYTISVKEARSLSFFKNIPRKIKGNKNCDLQLRCYLTPYGTKFNAYFFYLPESSVYLKSHEMELTKENVKRTERAMTRQLKALRKPFWFFR